MIKKIGIQKVQLETRLILQVSEIFFNQIQVYKYSLPVVYAMRKQGIVCCGKNIEL